jgi:signal transduction histidine kinase
VLELRAPPLAGRGLVDALRALADEVRARSSAPPAITVRGPATEPPPAVALGLYHIAREALTNAVRHARASRVAVEVARRGGRVRLRVADDGVGFDPSRAPADRFGLVGMRERARLLGATLRIGRGADGRGTTVTVSVPPAAARSGR